MFDRKSDILPLEVVPDFTRAPRPEDSELPDVPEPKTWELTFRDYSSEKFTSSQMEVGDEWFTFVDVTGHRWEYHNYNSAWCVKVISEVVARVKVSYVMKYRVVK